MKGYQILPLMVGLFLILSAVSAIAGPKCEGTDKFSCAAGGTDCQKESCNCKDPNDANNDGDRECSTCYACEGKCYGADPALKYAPDCKADFDWEKGDLSSITEPDKLTPEQWAKIPQERMAEMPWDKLTGENWQKIPVDKVEFIPPEKLKIENLGKEQLGKLSAEQIAVPGNLAKVEDLKDLEPEAAKEAIKSVYNRNIDLTQLKPGTCTIDETGKITNGLITLDLVNDVTEDVKVTALPGSGFSFTGMGTVTHQSFNGGKVDLNTGSVIIDGNGQLWLSGGSTYTTANGKVSVTYERTAVTAKLFLTEYDSIADQGNTRGIYVTENSLAFVQANGVGKLIAENGDEVIVTAKNFGGHDLIKIRETDQLEGWYHVVEGEASVSIPGRTVYFKEGKFFDCNPNNPHEMKCRQGDSDLTIFFYDGLTGEPGFTFDKNGVSTENINTWAEGAYGGEGGSFGWDPGSEAVLGTWGEYTIVLGPVVYKGAPGSDNWPTCWSGDGNLYTAWGDGGGFGGTNSEGRVSLGIAKLTGSPENPGGINIFGGAGGKCNSNIIGKSYGMTAVGNILYMFVSPGSGEEGYKQWTLYKSGDSACHWSSLWGVSGASLTTPNILQYNKGNNGQQYVYGYTVKIHTTSKLTMQKPGEIFVFRVPANNMGSKGAMEWYTGSGWSTDMGSKVPILKSSGFGWAGPSVSYAAGLNKYLLTVDYGSGDTGSGFAMYAADNPEGPWEDVLKMDSFPGEPSFFYNIPVKWMHGTDMYLIYTGPGDNDAIIIRPLRFVKGGYESSNSVGSDSVSLPEGCVSSCSSNEDCKPNQNSKCGDRGRCVYGFCAQCRAEKTHTSSKSGKPINDDCSQTTRGLERYCGEDHMCHPYG